METNGVKIVDHGRGPQLSTSRITVQDLVHHFQRGAAHEEIIQWIPSLSHSEIDLILKHYLDHKEEFDANESRLQLRREEQIRVQRLRIPAFVGTKEEHMARLRHLLEKHQQEKNGEGHPGGQ